LTLAGLASASAQTFTLTLQPNSIPAVTQGVAYNQAITAVGGNSNYALAVTSGALPAGITLTGGAGTWALTGTSNAPGSYSFTISATDIDGNTGFRPYTLSIGTAGGLSLSPSTLPNGFVGTAYSQTVTASGGSGGSGGYVYSISAGSLPSGLSINAGTGAITGTPNTGGPFTFTVFVRDSDGDTGSRTYNVNIGANNLTVSPGSLPNGAVGSSYSHTITASGGDGGPYTFTLASGTLPTGTSIASNGNITGTPTVAGPYTFTIQATDGSSNTGTRTYSVTIGSNILTVNPASLPNGTQGTAYSQTITASGGSTPYTFARTSGALPPGLSLSSGGVLSGTPTANGTFNFDVQATDPSMNTGTRSYSLVINLVALTINPASLPAATAGTAYSQTITASGGIAPYSFTVLSGSLPPGLALATGGALNGTPTTPGVYNFTVEGTDTEPNSGTRAYTINVGGNTLTVSPGTLPNGTQGTTYNRTVTASGGTGPYTFAVTAGALPAGLSLSSGGVIGGTPSGSGASSFTITATDTLGNTGSQAYNVNIGTALLTVAPASLPNGTQGSGYSQTVTASGGTGPYTFVLTSGVLPTGLTLSAGGVISGTASGSGAFGFTIGATDSLGNTGSHAYSVNIGTASLTVTPASLPNGTQATAYSQTLTASGGIGPYTFTLTAGALPAGLTMNAAGVISGTPTGSGASSFTVGVTDSIGNTGSRAYAVNIGTASLTVNPASVPVGTLGSPYSQTLVGTGGTGPYTFSLFSGALPAGLTLSSSGVISGTPTSGGASSFTVRAVDTLGNVGTRAYGINIGTVSLTVNPATLPAIVSGHPYSQTVTASGGTAPYVFAITGGALPPGLTLNAATGVISGTPTGSGVASFTIQATDINGNTGTRAFTLSNRPDPASDPDVQGLITAQVAAAQRFASAQIDNVSHHLESLHNEFKPCSVNFGIAPPLDPGAPIVSKDPWGPAYVTPPYAQQQAISRAPGTPDCALDWASSMAFWTAGSFQFGSMTPTGLSSANHFLSSGLTAGIDLRLTEHLIVGAALGFGSDRSDVGVNGSRSDATSFSGTLYASLRPFDPLFVDASAGYGLLNYDNRRWVTDDSTMVSGKRTGSFWFGGVTASLELGRGAMKFAPYVRADFISATLGGYAEQGSSLELLNYDQMRFNATSGAVGLRGSIDVPTSFGMVTPNARLEYRTTAQSAYDQSMYYLDLGPSTASTFSMPAGTYGTTTGTLGLRVRGSGGLTVELEYGLTRGTGALQAQTIRAALRVPF
jgi:uncharacterized protein YhjY with autotransporter beta-barrel domain